MNQRQIEDYYNEQAPDQKNEMVKKVLKQLAIVYARQANVFSEMNKTRNGESIDTDVINKSNAIKNFLINAVKYNVMTDEKQQILFGIDDNLIPCLNASLPGYTRASVDFDSEINTIEILKKVNEELGYGYFSVGNDISENEMSRDELSDVFENNKYGLNRFDITNTGLITSGEYEEKNTRNGKVEYNLTTKAKEAMEYKKYFTEKGLDGNGYMEKDSIRRFINIMNPSLEDRDVINYYLHN